MSTPINIIIDNKTVIDDVEACEIKQVEGQYCSSVSLSMKSKTFWTLCDPTTNFGTLRIKVVIGGTTYQFLTEERDTTPTKSGVAFTVWGRSKQALLSAPYSKTVNDTDDTTHPWQTGNTTASAIVAYVIANYCSYSVTVTWNAGDFVVYEDSFSVSNQAPIDVIAALANVIGAELVAAADGSLSIEAYSVAEGASVESYNDLDDIVQLGESIDYPSGYNAVTVYGYGAGGGGVQATISVERTDEGSIYPGRYCAVRVYFYHSKGFEPLVAFSDGYHGWVGHGAETITEDVQLIFGRGSTSKTSTSGVTEVTGNSSVPIRTVSVTYLVAYVDYILRGDEVGDYAAMFYFSDKSAYSVYSFSVSETTEETLCSYTSIVKYSPETVTPGGEVVLIDVYGVWIPTLYESDGSRASFVYTTEERITEEIVMVNGQGTLSKPFYSDFNISGYNIARWDSSSVTTTVGSTAISAPVDGDSEYYVHVSVWYFTRRSRYRVAVRENWNRSTYYVWGKPEGCDNMVYLSISVSEQGTDDVVLNVSNWASGVDVSGVDVEIDGVWVGQSDSNGNISVAGLALGDHTVKLTKDGYLQSDLDDIENSSFTVE